MEKCYECNSTHRVEVTEREYDAVPLCVKCFRLSEFHVFGAYWQMHYKVCSAVEKFLEPEKVKKKCQVVSLTGINKNVRL